MLMKIIGTIVLLCGISLIVLGGYSLVKYYSNPDESIKIVDCYDRFSNKIIGEQCEDVGSELKSAIFLMVMGSIIAILSSLFYSWEKTV